MQVLGITQKQVPSLLVRFTPREIYLGWQAASVVSVAWVVRIDGCQEMPVSFKKLSFLYFHVFL